MSTVLDETALTTTAKDAAQASARRRTAIRRQARHRRARVIAIQLAVVVVVLGAWQLLSGRVIDDLMISRPSDVAPTLWEWIRSGDLAYHASSTFKDAGLGLVLGGLAGLLIGGILGQSRLLAEIFEPFITAMYTLPKHALIPLFILWVGIGTSLRVLTAATIVFFLVFFNTFFGIKDVSESLMNSVRVMGGGRWDVMMRVRLPSALIWVVAALKLAVPQSIVGVVVAEMLAGDRGLGYLVARNAGVFNSAGTFAAIISLIVAGFLMDRLTTLITRKPLEWKNSSA